MTFLAWFALVFGVFYGFWSLLMAYWECPDVDADRGGFPVGFPPSPACSVSGEPPHTRKERGE